jgi:hypothetical protein
MKPRYTDIHEIVHPDETPTMSAEMDAWKAKAIEAHITRQGINKFCNSVRRMKIKQGLLSPDFPKAK